MLLNYEYLDVFVGVLKTIRRENGAETYEKQCGILCYLRTRLARLSRCALVSGAPSGSVSQNICSSCKVLLTGRCGRNNSPCKESVAGKKDNSGCERGFEV